MADAQKLSNPPKFGTQGAPSTAPKTIGDWLDFWRWLTSLWAVARESVNFPGVKAAIPPGPRGASIDEAIGASLVFRPMGEAAQPHADAATIQALTAQRLEHRQQVPPVFLTPQGKRPSDDLTALVQSALVRSSLVSSAQVLSGATILVGTHADRLALSIAGYSNGTLFFETDRTVFYILLAPDWRYAAGYMRDVVANLPSGLGLFGEGFQFLATDNLYYYIWTGVAWLKTTPPPTVSILNERAVLTGTTVVLTDYSVIGINFTGSSVNFTLPTAAAAQYQIFIIKSHHLSVDPIVVLPSGGNTIQGAASYTLKPNESIMIQSDLGSDWTILLSDTTPVTSLNTLTGAVTLAAGTNITLTPTGNTITIAASGGGGGVTSLTNGGSIGLSGSTGAVTISVSDPAWSAWTPTVTALGAVTTAVLDAAYIVTGKTVRFRIYWNGTLGTASTFINFTLPVTPKAISSPGFQTCAAAYFNNGTALFILAGVLNTGNVATRGATLPTITTQEIALEGVFELN